VKGLGRRPGPKAESTLLSTCWRAASPGSLSPCSTDAQQGHQEASQGRRSTLLPQQPTDPGSSCAAGPAVPDQGKILWLEGRYKGKGTRLKTEEEVRDVDAPIREEDKKEGKGSL